jgi:anti-anti-sigma regulatory factor
MFRAEILQVEGKQTLKIEGKLIGEWAREAKSLVVKESIPKGLIVDLTDVSCIDQVGEQVLNWFDSIGAAFVANNVYMASVCQRLGLQLQEPTSDPSKHRRRGGGRESSSGHNGSRPKSSNRNEE